MHKMSSFWFGTDINDFLIKGFRVETTLGFLSVCITTATLVTVYESLKMYQGIENLKLKPVKASPFLLGLLCSTYTERSILLEKNSPIIEHTSMCHLKSLFLYILQLIIGYLIMVIVMTYNVYLMISVVIGSVLGYFLFGAILLRITAQIFLERTCNDCQVSTDGQTTPIIEGTSSGFDNDSLLEYADAVPTTSKTVTVQIHEPA